MSPRCETTLVTGGQGFLGTHVVHFLLEDDQPVRVLDLCPGTTNSRINSICGSITDSSPVRRALKGVRRVLHLAAVPDLWRAARDDYYQVNVEGTRVVCELALEAGVEQFVYVSTAMLNCLGPDASTAPGPYTESKRRAEQIVLDHAAQGLPAVIVRPGGLIGPGDRRLTPPARMLLGLVNGTIRGYLDTYLWLQDVRDVARSVVHQTRDLMTGSVASISSHPVAFRALMDELHRLTGLPMPRLRVSRTVALAAAHLEELLTRWRLRSAPTASLEGIRVSPSSRPAPWDGPLLRTPLRPLSRTLSDTLKDFARRRLLTPRARAAVNDRCGAKSGTLSPEKFR